MKTTMTPEQCFFAVFCIEALADELHTTGDVVYALLSQKSDLLDSYIVPQYDALHTQGRDWIVTDLRALMAQEGLTP